MRPLDALQTAIAAVLLFIDSIICLVASVVILFKSFFVTKKNLRNPKSIFITGASSGIGEAMAIQYSRSGVALGLTGRNKERLDAVAEQCRQRGATVETFVVDVTDKVKLSDAIRGFDDRHRIDLIVANAGMSAGMIDGTFEDKLRKLTDVDLIGVFNTILPVIDRFKDRRNGQIAVVSSISGIMDFPRSIMYSMTKAACNNLCRDLREILGNYNVGVTAICPGFVQTGFTKYSIERRGKVPMLMDSAKAASIIIDGLAHNAPLISFPTRLYSVAFMFRCLPAAVQDLIIPLITTTKGTPFERLG